MTRLKQIHVIVGGQAGSEGKGHVAAQLAARAEAPTVIRVAGPNAGHTVINPATGTRHALRQIPTGVVTNPDAYACIAAGSEVDLAVLRTEVAGLEADGIRVRHRLTVDPSATVITEGHRLAEAEAGIVGRIGSTGKGIGAARSARIWRTADTIRDLILSSQFRPNELPSGIRVGNVAPFALGRGRDIHIEGTQGFLLGLHHHHYPQVTSSDCAALDMLQMARINPWNVNPANLRIWVVFRPYPIRVAGNSGPMHEERSWVELGLPEEKTTVTQKVRRVGLWDSQAARDAVDANGTHLDWDGYPDPIRLALTMADQLDPQLAGQTSLLALMASKPYQDFLDRFRVDTGYNPSMVTTSDRTCVWIPKANGNDPAGEYE